jgi:ADP-ribose pyrophosphatase YjhB (NUDIX family)
MTTGGPRILKIPEGDNRERKVCPDCGFIDYENPKIVVGSVVTRGEQVLLCRRAIEPRKGYWTIPAGYLELHETPEDGARREAQEEAEATIEIDGTLAVYAIPRLSQVQLIYHARLVSNVAPGPESLEVKLFGWDEIPWRDLAFPSVHWSLRQYREARESGDWRARSNPPEGL